MSHYTLTVAIQPGTPVEPAPAGALVTECETSDDVLHTLQCVSEMVNTFAFGQRDAAVGGEDAQEALRFAHTAMLADMDPAPEPYEGPTLDDLVAIARQCLGHAFPDKSFDELTVEDGELLADNLHHADEVLAEALSVCVERPTV